MSTVIALSVPAAWAETRGAARFVSGHPCRELQNRINGYIKDNFHDRAEQSKSPPSGASKQEIDAFNLKHPIARFFHELQKLSGEAGQTAARGQCTEVEKRRLEGAYSEWVRRVKQRHLTLAHDIDWAQRQQKRLQGLRGFDNGDGLFADFWRNNLASYDLSSPNLGGGRYIKTGELRPIGRLNSLLTAPNPKTARAPSQYQRLAKKFKFALDYLKALYSKALNFPVQITGRFSDWRSISLYRSHAGLHFGYDLAMPKGSKVIAGFYGKIVHITSWRNGQWCYGVYNPRTKLVVEYGHLSRNPGLRVGQWVQAGDYLARTLIDHLDMKMRPLASRNFVDFGKFQLPVDPDATVAVRSAPQTMSPSRAREAVHWLTEYAASQIGQLKCGLSLQASRKVIGTIISQAIALAPKYGINWFDAARLGISLCYAETKLGRDKRISAAGAAGPMQLMPDTARSRGLRVDGKVDQRFNLVLNVRAGMDYFIDNLSQLAGRFQKRFDRFWVESLAVASYNAGLGSVWNGRIPYNPKNHETKPYAQEAMNTAEFLRKQWTQHLLNKGIADG